ncbi:hypothetical protein PVT67_11785 [Gallaecimonas kandeliae]|uniref:hypothetical protein n=1 Tax=Gallaecimonas kandeliae TaxID=3029055 RepID=UPI0026480338|nr:hypothetical protein [Gallaecimonas kandeliae]WKE64359.1 hypothetical protein PVT67_11785 [Gallaecimonas kandeliae]
MTQPAIQLNPAMSVADLVRACMKAMGEQCRDDVSLDLQMGAMTMRLEVKLTELNGGPLR